MTGSGACVFCAFSQEHEAEKVLRAAQKTGSASWKVWKTKAIERHPLSHLLGS
jgi:4-diphosphocytidyl-2-C-methyl-D-erythritol kinase